MIVAAFEFGVPYTTAYCPFYGRAPAWPLFLFFTRRASIVIAVLCTDIFDFDEFFGLFKATIQLTIS